MRAGREVSKWKVQAACYESAAGVSRAARSRWRGCDQWLLRWQVDSGKVEASI